MLGQRARLLQAEGRAPVLRRHRLRLHLKLLAVHLGAVPVLAQALVSVVIILIVVVHLLVIVVVITV